MNPPQVIRTGYVIFAVTDIAAARHFYVDLLGLDVLHESPAALYLRGVEEREWSLKLELAKEAGVREIGFKAASDAALDEISALAEAQKLPQRWEREQDRPRLLRMQDPFGFPIAFYFQSDKHPWLLQDFNRHRGPGIHRIDHVNLFTPEVGRMTRWYQENLGFKLTEYTEDPDGRMWGSWLHRKGNVHDLALTNGTGPRLHHVAYWMPDGHRITQLCDILAGARACEKHLERGPGRHGISNAFFLYLRDPNGHRVELYTSDYLTADPDFEPIKWSLNDPRRQQLWGGIAPRSWFLEGSRVESFDGGWAPQTPSELGLPDYIA